MSDFVVDKIEEFAKTLLPSMGLELVDVQYRREGHGWVLRLFIDSDEGITVDDCARVSREVSDYLDVEDLIEHNYNLEVSSPGIERPLKSLADFERFAGKKARVKLREEVSGQKVFEGIIEKLEENEIVLQIDEKNSIKFDFDQIRKARLSL